MKLSVFYFKYFFLLSGKGGFQIKELQKVYIYTFILEH